MIWTAVVSGLKGLIAPATTLLKGWQARKQVKLENDLAIAKAQVEAKIERIKTREEADIAWENLSIDRSGWKDEYFTIVLSVPAVLCFIPGMVEYVEAGFAALQNCPDWYEWMLGIAVGSAFGYRKIADFMSLKKGA